jgi:hypothetical protein
MTAVLRSGVDVFFMERPFSDQQNVMVEVSAGLCALGSRQRRKGV